MITGVEIRTLNLVDLDKATVKIMAHIYYRLDDGTRLPGAWSRKVTFTVARSNARITALVNKATAWTLPLEQRAWQHLPELTGIQIYHIDFQRYGHDLGWGIAVNYHRLGQDGQPIPGFEGDTLWEVRQEGAKWIGGDCPVSQESLNEFIGGVLADFESVVCQLLGIA